MNKNILPISKEGMNNISYAIAFSILLIILGFDILLFFSSILIVGLLYLYRNPEREVTPLQEGKVVSPVDGKVISINDIEDELYAQKVVIESGFSDIGVLRTPMSATVSFLDSVKGSKLSSKDSLLADKLNENMTIIFEDKDLNSIKIKHTSRESINDISINTSSSHSLVVASRYGYMLNGITTIYLPKEFNLSLGVGYELTASQTVIGTFKK